MSSTTGAVLLIVFATGTMSYMGYKAMSMPSSIGESKVVTKPVEQSLAHIRFVIHHDVEELKVVLNKLGVSYSPSARSTRVMVSSDVCEVHILSQFATSEFTKEEVIACQNMLDRGVGHQVEYSGG